MTTVIKVEIDGQLLDLSECIWMETAPCGCLSGVSLASHMPLEADLAWADHLDSTKDAKRHEAAGYRFELRPRTELPKPWNDCPHVPKWTASCPDCALGACAVDHGGAV